MIRRARLTATTTNSFVTARSWQGVLLLGFLGLCLATRGLPAQDVLTYHNDNFRTGLNPAESILTPANVNSTEFGLLFTVTVDGLVDAQPLYASGVIFPNKTVHDVLIVATENDSVYAFDAVNGALLWQTSVLVGSENPSDDRGCGQVTPEIGVTATPVIDRTSGPHGTIYVVAMSKDTSGNYHQRLHALDLVTKAEEFGGPTEIQAKYPGTGDNSSNGYVIFDPAQYKERPGLLLLNGVIYTGWSSHCDDRPYTGFLMGYDEHTLAQTTVLNVTPNGNEGAIWQAGGGLAADPQGYIYFLVGNGSFDTMLTAKGFPNQGDYGNAFMKLSTAGGKLSVADYFTMYDTVNESDGDVDLGSGGAMLLPDMIDGTGKTRQLAVGAGKDSNIYLVDRTNMGKFNPNNDSNIYQELDGALPSGEWASPAYFNGTLYYGGVSDYLKAFQFSKALLPLNPTSASAIAFTYPGATPSVSANGTRNGIVWATENTSPAVLHAYDATNLANELYNSNQAPNGRDQFGSGNKFIAPMISHGRVYVGTTTGVAVFGLLPAATSVRPASLSFATEGVGSTSAAQAVSLSNPGSGALALTSITASSGFVQSSNCPSSLGAGAGCTISVTFTPAAPGPIKGSVTIVAGAGGPQTVLLGGVGTAADFVPSAISFSGQTVGTSSAPQSVTLTNKGAATLHLKQITTSGANAGDFSRTTTCGASLGAGASCSVSVTFTPTAPGTRTASVLFSDDGGGSPQSVALSGNGVAQAPKLPRPRVSR